MLPLRQPLATELNEIKNNQKKKKKQKLQIILTAILTNTNTQLSSTQTVRKREKDRATHRRIYVRIMRILFALHFNILLSKDWWR